MSHLSAPVPISVTLFNLLTPTTHEQPSSNRRGWLGQEYTSQLLVPVRLEILAPDVSRPREEKPSTDEEADEANEGVVVYSSLHNRGAIHPSWDHLDERTDLWDPRLTPERHQTYLSMRLRIVAARNANVNVNAATHVETTLANIPLHPSRLRRLPEDLHSPEYEGGVSWEKRPPPKALPPNAVLIHFSDGSTRVHPPLYHLLLEKRIIVEHNPNDVSLLEDEQEESRRTSRFSDDVFHTLDQVMWMEATVPAIRQRSPSSLLETDDETQAVPVAPLDDISRDLQHNLHNPDGKALDARQQTRHTSHLQEFSVDRVVPIEIVLTLEDLQREKVELNAALLSEEAGLEHELGVLHECQAELKVVMTDVCGIEGEIEHILREADLARDQGKKMEYLLEAHRIKLLRELRSVYPIRYQPEQRYFIRGQEIPSDLHAGVVGEDEISAALGFLSHSVLIISKYLSVPLRYRVVCNSSRSAIQENAVSILPLFQSRVVERDQLDRAMILIRRNVECILNSRGIRYSSQSHILAKVKRIYDTVADGR